MINRLKADKLMKTTDSGKLVIWNKFIKTFVAHFLGKKPKHPCVQFQTGVLSGLLKGYLTGVLADDSVNSIQSFFTTR